jgi:hypothetical protein
LLQIDILHLNQDKAESIFTAAAATKKGKITTAPTSGQATALSLSK